MVSDIHLSDWLPWERRAELPDTVGLYVIAMFAAANVIYVGRTWGGGGIRNRIRAFNRSASTGLKGHAGGVTYHVRIGPSVEGLMVRAHVPLAVNPDERIMRPYLDYAERRLIWEHVERQGALPVCNSA